MVQLNYKSSDYPNLSVFNVFTSDIFDGTHCKGNPAIVTFVDSLPILDDHLAFVKNLKHADAEKRVIPEFMTFVYICPSNFDINLKNRLSSNTNEFSIRWFSSTSIIKRCGHGTLAAAAFLIKNELYRRLPITQATFVTLNFHSDNESMQIRAIQKKNTLKIDSDTFALQLKQETLVPSQKIQDLKANLNILRENKTEGDDGYLIIELSSASEIAKFTLTADIIDAIGKRALIITAATKKQHLDVIFRYFAPFYGQLEDSATGSAATVLSPFWQARSRADQLRCYQASRSGGFFIIKINTDSTHSTSKPNLIEVIGSVSSGANNNAA
jgi:predicted PhzF superfamily epimerase YddE/YHI9